mgnify:CR=1 FL=1
MTNKKHRQKGDSLCRLSHSKQNAEEDLEISYNLCNLPKQITTVNDKTVKYTYFADGTKGKISFNKSDGGAGKLYDITDEEEAFKRQAYIGGVLS